MTILLHHFLHFFKKKNDITSPHRDEFDRHGLSGMVTVTHKNVLENGFGLSNVADAGERVCFSYWSTVELFSMNV